MVASHPVKSKTKDDATEPAGEEKTHEQSFADASRGEHDASVELRKAERRVHSEDQTLQFISAMLSVLTALYIGALGWALAETFRNPCTESTSAGVWTQQCSPNEPEGWFLVANIVLVGIVLGLLALLGFVARRAYRLSQERKALDRWSRTRAELLELQLRERQPTGDDVSVPEDKACDGDDLVLVPDTSSAEHAPDLRPARTELAAYAVLAGGIAGIAAGWFVRRQ